MQGFAMANLGLIEIALILMVLSPAIFILPIIFYLLSMQKALRLAGKEHRQMEPEMVWLMVIPLLGLVWQFRVAKQVASAVRSWSEAHGHEVGDAGGSLGLATCILACCCAGPFLGVLTAITSSPYWVILGFLTGIASLACWFTWWAKVSGFNEMMTKGNQRPL